MMLSNAYFTWGLVRLGVSSGLIAKKNLKKVRAHSRLLKADPSQCNILQAPAMKRFAHIPNSWQTFAYCGSKYDGVLVLQ